MGVMAAQGFGFRGDIYMTKTVRVVALARSSCLIFISSKYYQNMSKGIKVMERTMMSLQFLFHGR